MPSSKANQSLAGEEDALSDEHRSYSLCGVAISTADLFNAVAQILRMATEKAVFQVHLCNTFTLSLVDSDDELADALMASDMNLPDGVPVALVGNILRRVNGERSQTGDGHRNTRSVRGPSLVRAVAAASETTSVSHYFYGGADGVAERMVERLRQDYPRVKIAGYEAPPYQDLTSVQIQELVERLRESEASILWVGLGTPKQDYMVHRVAASHSIVIIPVGAAFDFLSGKKTEAPLCLQGSGFEWVFRLWQEPKRLWRRYLFGGPRFLTGVIRHYRQSRRKQRR